MYPATSVLVQPWAVAGGLDPEPASEHAAATMSMAAPTTALGPRCCLMGLLDTTGPSGRFPGPAPEPDQDSGSDWRLGNSHHPVALLGCRLAEGFAGLAGTTQDSRRKSNDTRQFLSTLPPKIYIGEKPHGHDSK
jgi:hypothetical protein